MLNVSAKRQIFNNRSRQNGNLTRIIYSEKKPIVKQKNYAILSFAVYQNHAETLSGISVSTTRHCNVVTTTNCASKIKWLQINFNVVIGLVLCILFDVKRACFPAQTPWSICARADTQKLEAPEARKPELDLSKTFTFFSKSTFKTHKEMLRSGFTRVGNSEFTTQVK